MFNSFRDVTVKREYVAHAFYCAFWGLFQFDDYKTAIDSIIMLGDNGTNAAIAGALLGAYYGFESISSNDVTNQNIEILLKCNPNEGDIKRPYRYVMNRENISTFVSNIG